MIIVITNDIAIPTAYHPAAFITYREPENGLDTFGFNTAMAVLTRMRPASTCAADTRVKMRTVHRTWICLVMNNSSVSMSKLAEAAAVQPTMNTLAAQDIISKFPRAPENRVDHATEAPKNAMASNAARLVLFFLEGKKRRSMIGYTVGC